MLFLSAFFVSPRLHAQNGAAGITGTVVDASGASIGEAEIQVKNTGTGIGQTATSDAEGRFRFPNLGLGQYELTASKSGFQTVIRKGITLNIGSDVVVDVNLPVGQAQQTVTVEGQIAQVETTTATVATLVDQKQIRELPLNGRNFEQLILLAPGVQAITTGNSNSFYGTNNGYSVAGTRPEGQAMLLDNSNLQTFWNRGSGAGILGTSLGVEAIGEFQTLTNTYGAQFGGAGAVVNAASKSGTNSYHGSVYEFLRNSALDSRNFFDGPSVPSFRRNQFGGSLGGPVKKDKAFFFVNYEGFRQALGETRVALVPDDNARNGILPGVATPITLSTAVRNALALYPRATSVIGGGIGQVTMSGNQIGHENYVLGRFDYTFSDKDSLFARFISDKADRLEPFNAVATAIPYWPEADNTHNQFATVEERHIFSPTIINLARAVFTRPNTNAGLTTTTSALQFFPGTGRPDGNLSVTGLSGVGGDTHLPFTLPQTKYALADDIIWTSGAHSIKIGASVERIQSNVNGPFQLGGTYTFTSLQNFLTGTSSQFVAVLPSDKGGSNDAWRYFRSTEFMPYIQDDWKVNARLTVNAGLRYELSTNPECLRNGCSAVLNIPTATGFTTLDHVFLKNPSTKNFNPRIGFAYDVFGDHKTSIRGGFGLYHNMIEARTYAPGLWMNPPTATGRTNNLTFSVPFTVLAATTPTGNSQTATTETTPYVMQYNLNIQREVLGNTVLSVGFVGSRSLHQFTGVDSNPPVATIAADGTPRYASLQAGKIVINNRGNTNFSTVNTLAPQSQSRYNSVQISANRRMSQNLQAQLSYTLSRCIDDGSASSNQESTAAGAGLTNPYSRTGDKGRCSFDITNALRLNSLYSLPFRQNLLVRGWQVSGILSHATGGAFSARDGFDQSGFGANVRPNVTAGCSTITGTVDRWFDPTCYSLQAVGAVGNLGRNTLTLPSLTNVDMSLLKNTNIPKISESFAIQFRAEVFNLFNHTNLGQPTPGVFVSAANGTGTISPTAGKITGTTTTSRQIQFGLKILF
jgi:hypothetical protein